MIHSRTRKAVAAVLAVAGCLSVESAEAQPLSARLLEAIEASVRTAAPPAARVAGDAPARPAPAPAIKMGLTSADPATPMASIGWNYYTASNCFSVYQGDYWLYTMNMTDGSAIWLSDTGSAAYLGSACAVGAGIAVRVTSVDGSSFSWDAMGFAP